MDYFELKTAYQAKAFNRVDCGMLMRIRGEYFATVRRHLYVYINNIQRYICVITAGSTTHIIQHDVCPINIERCDTAMHVSRMFGPVKKHKVHAACCRADRCT